MKRIVVLALLLVIPALAKADSYVQVTLDPFDFGGNAKSLGNGQVLSGDVTVGASFLWDTTSGLLSNFVITGTGPFATGLAVDPGQIFPNGTIHILNFSNSQGNIFQLDYYHGIIPDLVSTPGVYETDENFECSGCVEGFMGEGFGSATVTAVTVAATPEPRPLSLLLASLLPFLYFVRRKRELSAVS